MPFEIQLDERPAGYAAEAAKEGNLVKVITREFTSSEDGDLLIARLEGIPSTIIGKLPPTAGIDESRISNLLAIIRDDLTATVYVNELRMMSRVRLKRGVEQGAAIYRDDIAAIERLDFQGITISDDAAVLVVLSIGWRKALFFDFEPINQRGTRRDYDCGRLLGQYYGYLQFQHLFKITDQEQDTLLDQQWFPFLTLQDRTIKKMIQTVRAGESVDHMLDEICEELTNVIGDTTTRWSQNAILAPHMPLLQHALERYSAGDYISATAILYPRIEGIMRAAHQALGSSRKMSKANLVRTVIEARQGELHDFSLLLPKLFQRYLENVYFADFRPGFPARVSRHSVSHGVAEPSEYSKKGATLGLLTLDQIVYYLPSRQTDDE